MQVVPDTQIHKSQKLYIIVRNDLEPGLQAAQATHAITDLIFKYPEEAAQWREKSNYVVILSTKDEKSLHKLAQKLKKAKAKLALFLEPDINMEATALAVLPGDSTWRLLAKLPLALKEKPHEELSDPRIVSTHASCMR